MPHANFLALSGNQLAVERVDLLDHQASFSTYRVVVVWITADGQHLNIAGMDFSLFSAACFLGLVSETLFPPTQEPELKRSFIP